jgi:hypothetical protein
MIEPIPWDKIPILSFEPTHMKYTEFIYFL